MIQDFLQIAQMMSGRNPEECAKQIIQNNSINDPMISQMINFAQTGNTNQLMQLATSFFSQRGIDFGKEFSSFMSMIK